MSEFLKFVFVDADGVVRGSPPPGNPSLKQAMGGSSAPICPPSNPLPPVDNKMDAKVVTSSTTGSTPSIPGVDEKKALVPTPSKSPQAAILKSLALQQNLGMGARGNNSKRGSIKAWICETLPRAITSDASTGLYGFTSYFNDVRNMVDFTTYASLYDQYRIIEVVHYFDPAYAGTTGGTVQPGLVVATDVDNFGSSSNSSAGISNVLNYQGGFFPVERFPSVEPRTIRRQFSKIPKKADSIDGTSVLLSMPGSWTNCQTGAGNVGGLRAAGISSTATSRPIGFLYCAWHVEFRFKFA